MVARDEQDAKKGSLTVRGVSLKGRRRRLRAMLMSMEK
jgi:hypothetical protein